MTQVSAGPIKPSKTKQGTVKSLANIRQPREAERPDGNSGRPSRWKNTMSLVLFIGQKPQTKVLHRHTLV